MYKTLKHTLTYLIAFCTLSLASFRPEAGVRIITLTVKAPFDMPAIKVPDFSRCKKLNITSFGAVRNDKEKIYTALTQAIAEANEIGGGVVVIPEGKWLTKKCHLKSNFAITRARSTI